MTSTLKIRTPEGITFSYLLAGPVVRCLAWIMDFLIIIAMVRMFIALASVAGIINLDLAQAFMVLGMFVISIGYGLLCEWLWRGQTFGKRMMRLRVMDAQGMRLQFHQILLRNLLRFVDMLPFFYLVGGLTCYFTRREQRLGDLAANTIVVYNTRHAEPDLDQLLAVKFNSLRQYPHLEARLRQRVSAAEARLALQALVRRDELDPVARVELFADLADHFKAAVTFPADAVESVPDEQYVRNVVDILFRARGPEKKTSRSEDLTAAAT